MTVMTFVAQHGLWTDAQTTAAHEITALIARDQLDTVRFSFPDQHGILRGKTLMAAEAARVLDRGVAITTTLLLKDTAHRTVFPVFTAGGGLGLKEMEGAADVLMVADPATFRTLPWAPRTGWVLCDLHFADGRPVPYATRRLMRQAVEALAARGMTFRAGLEVEFHLFKRDDPKLRLGDAGQPGVPPSVSLLSHGYQYLTEQRYDALEPVLEILRRHVVALGLPLRSMEIEYGPSQVEFTFEPRDGLKPADHMVLFKSAIKQIAQRHGYHATFMCRPQQPLGASSGWHLHQSLVDQVTDRNLFMADAPGIPLSGLGMHYLAGILRHANELAVCASPTINGYKRYRTNSLAPDRAVWGRDNRGVMLRVLGGAGDNASRIENRIGEPTANPYLYMASQIHAGLDGIDFKRDPGPSADSPYEATAPLLPKSLMEAVAAFRTSTLARASFGDGFVDYYAHIKEAEIARFLSEVTDWEQREYFELF